MCSKAEEMEVERKDREKNTCTDCAVMLVRWQANSNKFLGFTCHANLMNTAEYKHNAEVIGPKN